MGKTSFAILLFQDIAAIPLMALVPLLAEPAPGASARGSGWLGAAQGARSRSRPCSSSGAS